MRYVILHVDLVPVTCLSYAQPMTKEQISYEVQDAHNRLRSPIGSDDSCKAIASAYIDDLTESHSLFLKDSYYPAIVKTLDVISLSARKSIGFPNCRSSIVL